MQEVEIHIAPEALYDESRHRREIARKLGIKPGAIVDARLHRRSIDARHRRPRYVLRYQVWVDERPTPEQEWNFPLQQVDNAEPVLIVGFGPAGMFAALRLIELGYKPIVLERGKGVRERRRDLAALNKEGIVNPDSNYCFGEGGAGTFSDGKLYTRSTKRGDVRRVLEILVRHGAVRDILIDAHPHIGTNKLPKIIQSIRETILAHGGEVHFGVRVEDFILNQGTSSSRPGTTAPDLSAHSKTLTGLRTQNNTSWKAPATILATGHSARDIFRRLHQQGIGIEAKPFALGVRVEHPQPLIDQIRYRCNPRPENIPAASYSLVKQVRGQGVYSFCMCPGGIICPAATEEGEVVVNGWSPSKRNSPYANSGIVTEVRLEDLPGFDPDDPFSALDYQAAVERQAFQAGGGKQVAPAQRLVDFVEGRPSGGLPACSYLPGLEAVELGEVLPQVIRERLQMGFRAFGDKLKGYLTNEALVAGVESRTSSPVRIPRGKEDYMHPEVAGLFPCGEGPGYAGGIMSAAMDGERVAEAVVRFLGGGAS